MAILVPDISLPFTEPPDEAVEKAKRLLGCGKGESCRVVKQSLDARRKGDIRYVYTIAVDRNMTAAELAKLGNPKIKAEDTAPLEIAPVRKRPAYPPVVTGFGPAGMFAALVLARAGLCPVVLEKGDDVDARVAKVKEFWGNGRLDPDSNVQFGEGGAGTFSDGKLTTRIGDGRCRFVLEEFHRQGAPDEILYRAKPHVGTDRLRGIVKGLREEILALGGTVLFRTSLTGLLERGGVLTGVGTTKGDMAASALVLAPGNSARDLFPLLLEQGISLTTKPFSVGVRIEHLQSDIDEALYGGMAGHPMLPKGEYQLSHRRGGRAVYTFCMCPGGVVVPAASEEGMLCVNGMSEFARDGRNANAALVVSVDERDFGRNPMDGVAFQRGLEAAAFRIHGGYRAPVQSAGRFLDGKPGFSRGRIVPSYAIGAGGGDIDRLLPPVVTDLLREGLYRFDRKLRGFAREDSLLTGVETRTSSPVRIPRGEDLQAPGLRGVYPCGEGAGYAGGIMSAAVDGIRCAQAIIGAIESP